MPAMRFRRFLGPVLATALLLRGLAALSPLQQEVALGLVLAAQVENENKVVEDHPAWPTLMRAASRVLMVLPVTDRIYTVQVIRAPVANAFALPGGFVFVTDKLLDLKLSEEEMAFLIGHETTHIRYDHFARIQHEQGKVGFLTTLTALSSLLLLRNQVAADRNRDDTRGDWNRPGAPEVTGADGASAPPALAPILAGNIFGTLYLLHSQRDLELEADLHGARAALAAGYPLKGGMGLLDKLFTTNYRDVRSESWQTHPLTQARHDQLNALLADEKPGRAKSEEAVDLFREEHCGHILKLYEEIPSWPRPLFSPLRGEDPGKLRRLLLGRARRFADGDAMKGRVLRLELTNHLLPEAEKSPFLVADYGELAAKFTELKKLGEPTDDHQEKEVRAKARASLEEHLQSIQRASPGLELYRYLARNYPEHEQAGEWRLQAWIKNPDEDAKLADAPALLDVQGARVREDLTKLADTTKDPLNYRRAVQILNREVDATRLEKLVTACEKLERLCTYQHEFPADAHLSLVLKRRQKLAERKIQEGRMAKIAGRPDKAVEAFHEVVFYDQGSAESEEASDLIFRLNTLKPRREPQ